MPIRVPSLESVVVNLREVARGTQCTSFTMPLFDLSSDLSQKHLSYDSARGVVGADAENDIVS